MSYRDDLDKAFAEELSALDSFFDRRAEEHEYFALGRQDPDVRRILEAVAFFSARTRVLARKNVTEAVERLVRGQLDDLLSPVPSAGMLLANVHEGLGASLKVPRGTEVRLVAPDRTVGVFATKRDVDLLPLRLQSVKAPMGADRLDLRLDAWVELRGELPPVRFAIDSRGSYRDSLRLLSSLEKYLRAVRVSLDEDDPENATPVSFSFGGPDEGDGRHPFEKIRSFFHFPQQDLFFSVNLPARRKPFQRAFVYLDLDRDAPRELLRAGRQSFLLFAVPLTNARRSEAAVILCDGTKDSYPIRDTRPEHSTAGREAQASLATIEGAYKLGPKGPEPIPPALVADTGAAYDPVLVHSDEPGQDEPRIALRIPGAFEKPCKVIVDATWYQPSFDSSAAGYLEPSLPTRRLEGARLEMMGDLQTSRKSALADDSLGLLHVMALRTKVLLTRDELVCLLRCFGADRRSHYRRLPDLVKDVRAEEAPGTNGRGKKYVYRLEYRQDDPDFEGLLRDGLVVAFEDQISALLEAWIADEVELVRFREALPGEGEQPKLRLVAGGGA